MTSSVTSSAPNRSACLRSVVHQVGAHDAVGEAGEVLDVGGVHQRAAGGDRALEHQRRQVGARGVDRGGVARRARADDDHVAYVAHSGPLLGACRMRVLVVPPVTSTGARGGMFPRERPREPSRAATEDGPHAANANVSARIGVSMFDRARECDERHRGPQGVQDLPAPPQPPLRALADLDLVVDAGGGARLPRPEWSGKTTTSWALLGLIGIDTGELRLLGRPVRQPARGDRRGGRARRDAPVLPELLRVGCDLRLLAQTAGVPRLRVEHVLEIVELRDRAAKHFAGYSLGMKQRLGIARRAAQGAAPPYPRRAEQRT